ncbi:MAG: Plug domain-containing protein [Hymenobacter sp.]
MTLPGVKTSGEGSTAISVRGGNTDQNLILFNDAVVYSPSHLFGFFSAFNPDMLKTVELYKSSIPARYGGRPLLGAGHYHPRWQPQEVFRSRGHRPAHQPADPGGADSEGQSLVSGGRAHLVFRLAAEPVIGP